MSYSNWPILAASFVIVTYLALICVSLCAVRYLVDAKWRLQVRDVAVSLTVLAIIGFMLMRGAMRRDHLLKG
jgi:uncharacterized membrane protein